MEITKREIIASITIIAIMLLGGVLISSKISDYELDKNEKYNKALKIDNKDLFEYAMNTDTGYAFVYGTLKAVDPVSYPDIKGEYLYIRKVKERYTEHTRVETYYTGSGKTRTAHTRTVTYWTWDEVNRESKKAERITFCEMEFKSNKIILPGSQYIKTVSGGYHIRYVYYGCQKEYKGTIFSYLSVKTIKDNSSFYENNSIEETEKRLETNIATPAFWVIWIIITVAAVYGFYYLDNEWLE